MFEQAQIKLDRATLDRLKLLLHEDLAHGEGTPLMAEILGGLNECDRIVLEIM